MPDDRLSRLRVMVILRCSGALTLFLAGAVLACAQAKSLAPVVSGQSTFQTLCSGCHSPQRATSSRQTRSQWLQTVNQMVARGAQGTDEQLLAVVDYLSENYSRVNINSDPATELEHVGRFTPAQAEAIVKYRGTHGSIDNISELSRAIGIPQAKLEAESDVLTFGTAVPGVGRVPVAALTESNNWPTVSGTPQRDDWSRQEEMLTPETVRNLKLVYRDKLENQSRGLRSLTAPIVLGTLIGYQGFKQMLILGGSSGEVYSLDADLNRQIWKQSFEGGRGNSQSDPTPGCQPTLSAVVMPGSTSGQGFTLSLIRRPGAFPPHPRVGSLFADAFGRTGPVVVLRGDGALHVLYQSNGAEAMEPIKFLEAGSLVSGVNLDGSTVYAATVDNCGGPNAIYALDLESTDRKVVSFPTNGSEASGAGGTALGSDGTVYAQIADGHGDVAGKYNDTVLALTAKELKVKDYFTPSEALPAVEKGLGPQGVTPMVFAWNKKELILAGGRDGRLYLLEASSLGGVDHHTPLDRSEPIVKGSAREAFATWTDPNTNTTWVYASLWGRATASAKFSMKNGPAKDGAIAAFRVEDRNGKPVLVAAWTSENMVSPSAPATANGVVFAVSTGLPAHLSQAGAASVQRVERAAKPAALYAFDALTGKKIFRSAGASSFSDNGELAIANGRVYFTTHDNTVYAYGFPMEQ
ncbi:MAG: helix-hairpin-helix domain-containing protein [Acidobacteria bacterium]|nr:helix-hairpin-helix domain-containing protein [Acidobacteriota bacterium]